MKFHVKHLVIAFFAGWLCALGVVRLTVALNPPSAAAGLSVPPGADNRPDVRSVDVRAGATHSTEEPCSA